VERGGLSPVTFCPSIPNKREPDIVAGVSMHNLVALKRMGYVEKTRGIYRLTDTGLTKATQLFAASEGQK